jgi:hypothetical protein
VLRLCSDLGHNKLTGSVPSSLSALTSLLYLCVLSCAHGVCARPYASDRSALRRARGELQSRARVGASSGAANGRCGTLDGKRFGTPKVP